MRQLLPLLVWAFSSLLWADPANQQLAAQIDASGQAYQGNLMFNQAAGSSQQQANARAIAVGDNAGASTRVEQLIEQLPPSQSGITASARIGGNSFSQGSGLLGINQSAGIGNQQINALRMASGLPEGLDDSALAQQSVAPSTTSGTVEPQSSERFVAIDEGAFGSSRGVVQLNQSAGVGNRSINNLAIRVAE
ncbi:MAG: adhesin [Pseudomonadaceae bacterium]|nr:adhesin [Pseudomonadaceae bacterium]